ncbi:MAG TPA: PCP reductase family protein [Rhodothermales bacterium]|nr:PCP reductase family protein [Rhodothermales bacterium]
MKFLCVSCDRQMKLTETLGPDEDAISAIFSCPECGHQVAMLTNSMETQLVKSLDVKIGRGAELRGPMSVVRTSLLDAPETVSEGSAGGKCPFTGAVKEAFAAGEDVVWTEAARERLERIPEFVRPMVKRGIEQHARDQGIARITEEVMADVRTTLGM